MTSTESAQKVKQTFSKKVYSWYLRNGYDRFLNLSGKVPTEEGEYRYVRTLDSIKVLFSDGFDIGVLIPVGRLVIDIDPRNGGIDGFNRLLADAYKDEPRIPSLDDLIDSTFTVKSGGGGYHLYFAHGPGLKPRGSVKGGYPGVDLKGSSNKHYVAGPGSVHADTRQHYKVISWQDAPGQLPAPLAPFILAPLRDPFGQQERSASPHPLWGLIGPAELETLLAALDPKDYRAYVGDDKAWINLMSACHHATGGHPEAMDVFARWSSQDPKYANDARKAVEKRWGSFKERRDGTHVATVDSILAAVEDAVAASVDVAELLGEPDGAVARAAELASDLHSRKIAKDLEVIEEAAGEASSLLVWIESLPESWRQDDPAGLQKLIGKIAEYPELHWPELCAALSKRAGGGISQAQIKKHVRQERNRLTQAAKPSKLTAARIVDTTVDKALKVLEPNPFDIACVPGQAYLYNTGVWEKIDKSVFGDVCYSQLETFLDKDERGTQALCNYARDAATSIMHKRATNSKALYCREEMPNCVNLLNGTLWFSKDGTHELKPHLREDYLTTQIPYAYDPLAKCPSFDKMLEQVFDHIAKDYSIAERDHFIRYFWELIGYVIQPNKDLPVAMFWIGEGQNGKSRIAKIISNLIGSDALLSVDIKAFFNVSNQHSTTALENKLLVMDDDLGSGTTIDDGALKKVSENCILDVNPKNKNIRKISVHTTALIITNNKVKINDTSNGFVRRCHPIYFNTDISHLQKSTLPEIAEKSEMPGILNKAVQGLARLRERGEFDLPKCSRD